MVYVQQQIFTNPFKVLASERMQFLYQAEEIKSYKYGLQITQIITEKEDLCESVK
jgi:hypothetical protein